MSVKLLTAGDPIESRCTKCRRITNHIIVAIVDAAPNRVQCNICGGQHNYRPLAAATKKRTTRSPADPTIAEQEEWQRLRPSMDGSKARDYSMDGDFKVKSLINHHLFGLGMVQRILGDRKIEVLFESGKKNMRCK
jgi:hypothetical protein